MHRRTTILFQGDVSVDEIDGLEPGEGEGSGPGTAFVSDVEGSLAAGNYIFTATADFPNDVAELNETTVPPTVNNVSTRSSRLQCSRQHPTSWHSDAGRAI